MKTKMNVRQCLFAASLLVVSLCIGASSYGETPANQPPQFGFPYHTTLGQISQQNNKYRIAEGDSVSLPIFAADPEGDAPLTMSIVQSPASPPVAALSNVSGTQHLNMTPAPGSHGIYYVTLSVWDASHDPAQGKIPTRYTFQLTVDQKSKILFLCGPSVHNDKYEVIYRRADLNIFFNVTAARTDKLKIVSWEYLIAPPAFINISVINDNCRHFSCPAFTAEAGTYPITIRVKDENNNAAILQLMLAIRPTNRQILDAIKSEILARRYPGGPYPYDADFDLNNDGRIDMFDIKIFQSIYNRATRNPIQFNIIRTKMVGEKNPYANFDLNSDGKINAKDVIMLRSKHNKTPGDFVAFNNIKSKMMEGQTHIGAVTTRLGVKSGSPNYIAAFDTNHNNIIDRDIYNGDYDNISGALYLGVGTKSE